MTRNPKAGMRHAASAVAPFAAAAKYGALHRAHLARAYVVPRARGAADAARNRYDESVVPRLERAAAAAGPAGRSAGARSAGALAALRSNVTPREIRSLVRRRERRARTARTAMRLTMLGLAAGAAFAAWRWWDHQSGPDWLMEPEPATDVPPEQEEPAALG